MRNMQFTVSVTASEKLSPAQYESLERSVAVTGTFEIDEGEDLDKCVEDVTLQLQLRAEAQMYAALSRGMVSRGNRAGFLAESARNRVARIGIDEKIDAQCAGNTVSDSGVIR